MATAAGRATTNRAPCGSGRLAPQAGAHRFAEALGGVQPDAGPAGGVRVAPGVGLEDPLAPLRRGCPGPRRVTPSRTTPSTSAQSIVIVVSGGRVLDRVLDEVLEDLAEARRVGQGVEPDARHGRRRGGGRAIGRSEATTSSTSAPTSTGVTAAGPSGTTRTDARIESTRRSSRSICSSVAPCQAARGLAPVEVARFAARERRLLGEQVGVGADDRERRPQLVGDEGDQLAAGLVDRLERLDPRLGLGLLAALLDDPGEQVGDRPELGDVARR